MNEIEREELEARELAKTEEEKRITAGLLPDGLLWDELQCRYNIRSVMVGNIRETVRE